MQRRQRNKQDTRGKVRKRVVRRAERASLFWREARFGATASGDEMQGLADATATSAVIEIGQELVGN